MPHHFRTLLQPRLAWITVLAVTVLAAAAGVFTLPVLDRDEARFAQATVQMLETGDFVRISFLDEDRHKKPVGIHWVQVATVTFGDWVSNAQGNRQIWAWRLTSVIGAALAALATMAMANRLLGHPAGLYAGVMIGTSVLLGAESGIAKTDAMLAGITAWALYALVRLHEAIPGRSRLWALLLWILIALGALIKGPVTPLAIGLGAIGLVIWERRAGWLRPLAFWPGPVLAALILLPWLISVQIATGGDFLREALGEDLGPKLVTGHESHGGPPGYHLLLLAALFFPAILFLPAGIRVAVIALRTGSEQAGLARLLVVLSLPLWLVFELLPTKLPHYVLPAYPVLAVLAAWGVMRWQDTPLMWRSVGTALTVFGGALLCAVLVAISLQFDGPAILSSALTGLIALLILAAVISALRQRATTALVTVILAALVWHTGARGIVAPATSLFLSRDAANLIRAEGWLTADAAIRSSYTEPSLAFSLRSDTTFMDFEVLAEASADLSAEQVLIIDLSRLPPAEQGLSDDDNPFLTRLRTQACSVHVVEGFNYSRGRATSLLIARTGDCTQIGDARP